MSVVAVDFGSTLRYNQTIYEYNRIYIYKFFFLIMHVLYQILITKADKVEIAKSWLQSK